MREKIILLFIGTGASVVVALASFLIFSYFGSFVSKAEYLEDKAIISVILNDIKHLKNGQNEIKILLKKKH